MSAPLYAREVTVLVLDADMDLPLEGVNILLPNGSAARGGDDGRVRFDIDGAAALRVSYPGYETLHYTLPAEGGEFTLKLRIAAPIESGELVFEAQRSGLSGNPARSITLSRRELDTTAHIGLIEDVMTSIKLLPGVGYAGMFNAQPSIRGGDPGDLQAVFDGFYIDNPYHWGGMFSLFDPKMVDTATLSHGVFSARYGYSSSGILEVRSRRSSRDYAEIEAGVSTSALNLSAAVPLGDRSAASGYGGVSAFGKITYWDGFVLMMKGLSRSVDGLDAINSIEKAPFIQCGSLNMNYRWMPNLEGVLNAYAGGDGVTLKYERGSAAAELMNDVSTELHYLWSNFTGFVSGQMLYNPINNIALRLSGGGGFNKNEYQLNRVTFSINPPQNSMTTDESASATASAQFRAETDIQLNATTLISAGVEELYRNWQTNSDTNLVRYWAIPDPTQPCGVRYVQKTIYSPGITNQGVFSSGWGIVEWKPSRQFSAELGLRADHLVFIAEDFTSAPLPEFNPRVHLTWTPVSNAGVIDAFSLSAGTGLYSSIVNELTQANSYNNLEGLRQMRTWTNVAGAQIEFASGWNINLECYYKYVFNRIYSNDILIGRNNNYIGYQYFFNGYGHVGGVDVLIQKIFGDKLTGWLSYSFNITRYNNPQGMYVFYDILPADGSKWYYPQFHRFHTLNLILNYYPVRSFSIYTRVGFASGIPMARHNPQLYYEDSMHRQTAYHDAERYSDALRNAVSLPLDIKCSYHFFYPNGKTQGEVYFAVENTLVMILPKMDTRVIDRDTGRLVELSDEPVYNLPVPMVSFGFKWSY